MLSPKVNNRGFTLIELVIVLIIVAIIATVAMRKMSSSIDNAQFEQTKKELDQLAYAISGNPSVYSKGARTDFGYVGDVGATPPNLDALVQNPGGYTTWKGPYMNTGIDNSGYKQDAWQVNYVYFDTLIRSVGSGTNIDKLFANSTSELLANSIEGFIVDADSDTPGSTYSDSVVIILTYPDGVGSITTLQDNPNINGDFTLQGIPIGIHSLSIIYIPDSDTVSYQLAVNPGSTVKLEVTFPADLW